MKNPDTVKKFMASRRFYKKSHIENQVIDTINRYNLPLVYTGDFSFWVGDKENGYINPDFLFEEKEIVYEIYDPTFKYKSGFRDKQWEEKRTPHYKKFGYTPVFIQLTGWVNGKEKEDLAVFIRKTI